jgi:hypothetical protein
MAITKITTCLLTVLLLALFAMNLVQRNHLELWIGSDHDEVADAPSNTGDAPTSSFDQAYDHAFSLVEEDAAFRRQERDISKRGTFNISKWTSRTKGGLNDDDRIKLAEVYGQANSVFEFGLGESTYIADWVGVPRYSGVDSDVVWVDMARRKVSDHFRFYYGDTGNTGAWGVPEDPKLPKNIVDYQLGALGAERLPFDVYMVDGRYRLPLLLLSFLHASSRGGNAQDTTVLLHDCYVEGFSKVDDINKRRRGKYHKADHILEMVDHSRGALCIYKRKSTTTDEQIFDVWKEFYATY